MATLTYYYPEQHDRSEPDPKFKHERSLAYMPLALNATMVLYDDQDRPLAMYWVSHSDMMSGLKTRLQSAFKRKAEHNDTGMYSWPDMDEQFLLAYLFSREMYQLDCFWRRG